MVDWIIPFIITISYLVIALMLGYRSGRGKNMNKLEEWGVGGRSFGSIVMYLLIASSGVSAYTFMGAPGWAYSKGIPIFYLVVYLTYMAFITWYFGPRVWELGRKYKHVTQASAIADRYDSQGLGMLASLVTSIGVLAFAVLQITGSSYIIHLISGQKIPTWAGVILVLIVIGIYLYKSGLRAIGITNAFQAVVMFIVAWVVGMWGTKQFTGQFWFGAVFERVKAEAPDFLTLPGAMGEWSFAFWTTSILISMFSIWPMTWVQWMGATNKKTIRKAAALLPTYYVMLLPMFVIGFIGIFIYSNLDNPDYVAIQYVMDYLPGIVAGILGVGTLAASMSSSEPCIHSVSLSYTVDIIKPIFQLSDRAAGKLTRLLIFPIMGFVIAPISIMQPASLAYILLIGYGFIGQTFPSILGMFFWPRATKYGAFWGLFFGFIITLLFSIAYPHPLGIHAGIWGLIVNVSVFVIVSLMTKPASEETVKRFFPEMADDLFVEKKTG